MLLYNSTNTYQNPHEEVILKFLVFKDLDYLERIWGSGDCIELLIVFSRESWDIWLAKKIWH